MRLPIVQWSGLQMGSHHCCCCCCCCCCCYCCCYCCYCCSHRAYAVAARGQWPHALLAVQHTAAGCLVAATGHGAAAAAAVQHCRANHTLQSAQHSWPRTQNRRHACRQMMQHTQRVTDAPAQKTACIQWIQFSTALPLQPQAALPPWWLCLAVQQGNGAHQKLAQPSVRPPVRRAYLPT